MRLMYYLFWYSVPLVCVVVYPNWETSLLASNFDLWVTDSGSLKCLCLFLMYCVLQSCNWIYCIVFERLLASLSIKISWACVSCFIESGSYYIRIYFSCAKAGLWEFVSIITKSDQFDLPFMLSIQTQVLF